jgi:hypothetical protein
MKTCKVGCGKMKAGGPIKKVKKMSVGGMTNTSKMLNDIITRNGLANSGTTGPYSMKVGGASSLPVCKGGLVRMPDGSCGNRDKYKSGGSVKKFAALAPPYDKATAADRIAGAKKNARKKGKK